MGLQGKVAIVTGGSRGIGAATSRLLAARGASVIVNYVQNAAVAENVVLDVQQVAHLIADTVERYGRIDILLCGIRIGRNYP